MSRRTFTALTALAFLAGCKSPSSETLDVHLTVDARAPLSTIDSRFLSVGLDTTILLGGTTAVEGQTDLEAVAPLDLTSPKLRTLLHALAPTYLKIGGTGADQTYFSIDDTAPLPDGFTHLLTGTRWDALGSLAKATDTDLVFTLNAGPGPRDATGNWIPDNARALLEFASIQAVVPIAWAFGHEPNEYPTTFGFTLSADQYGVDFAAAQQLLHGFDPTARLLGANGDFRPQVGELGDLTQNFLDHATATPDVVAWHYAPFDGRRCATRINPVVPDSLFSKTHLDELDRWSERLERLRDVDAHLSPIWLTDVSDTRCGGEPGFSDSYRTSLFWVDTLGRIASRGTPVLFHRSLVGGDDGLLDQQTLAPNPAYWPSVLFRRLMGQTMLAVSTTDSHLLAYAACTRLTRSSLTLLLLNLDAHRSLDIALDGRVVSNFQVYQVTAPDPDGRTVSLNGGALTARDDGTLPTLTPALVDAPDGGVFVSLEPLSYAFVVAPGITFDSSEPACP